MLRSIQELTHYSIRATDGEMGSVHDFYFDDRTWKIRYLVVDTGNWLPGRKALIPVSALGEANWKTHLFSVKLSLKQIEDSPSIETDLPVSRQREASIHDYFGWAPYWGVDRTLMGAGTIPVLSQTTPIDSGEDEESRGDPDLRGCREVRGYHIKAKDGEVGHIEDFLLDEEDWTIRYLEVDTRNWLPGRRVLLAPDWVEGIYWNEQLARVALSQKQVKESPEYNPDMIIDRYYENELYQHYGFPGYWV